MRSSGESVVRDSSASTSTSSAPSMRRRERLMASASCLTTKGPPRGTLMSQPLDTLLTVKLDAYIRVSQVRGRSGPSFISPAQQRERIAAWMTAFGYECGEVFEELDQSGGRKDRPLLMQAIGRVERGESDGIVVAKLDRFGRSLVDGLQLIDRIQDAGGTFASVQDGFDLRTATGRLVLRIMLSMAEYELERVRAGWHDAKARAVMRGIHPSARAPFGYRREGRGGPLRVDETTGPLVSEMFRRRARARVSYTELAHWMNGQGVRTGAGRARWSMRGVKDIIRNRVYLGIAYAGDIRTPTPIPRSPTATPGARRSATAGGRSRARRIRRH
jgi:DNA invertase Pin-like site-specific DNA recombinase